MSLLGQAFLMIALVLSASSALVLFSGHAVRKGRPKRAEKLANAGYLVTFATTLALTICVAVLVYGFFAGDYSLLYVALEHSENHTSLAWLFKLAGLWGGSQGSLLLWAWLISLFQSFVALRQMHETDELSNMAIAVMSVVLSAFICVLAFSSTNNPFQATPAMYLSSTGELVGNAQYWGMNALLEHWAMAIHPPTLFVGYAGFTVPFAYAVAALVTDDPSSRWVELCNRVAVFSWFFLTLGIGLGAVWAYVVLGWGGYWGWDPVENASLLSWLVGLALIHSFTIYRRRGEFKRWAVLCSGFTFAFVIIGTFITRSGIVDSVHAFEGDQVSLVFFSSLIVASVAVVVVGLLIRRRSFEASEEIESLASKNTAYYLNNVIMIVCSVLVLYLTISAALPSWMPFGGHTFSSGTYDAIARPIGVLYLLLASVCPLLSWRRTDGAAFRRNMRWPLVFAVALFALLVVEYFTKLLPVYDEIVAGKGLAASSLLSEGPSWYYNGIALLGLFVASLLLCNTLYLFVRGVSSRHEKRGESRGVALLQLIRHSPAQFGGYIAHLGMAFMLVGLIGSNMYVAETAVNLENTEGASVSCRGYNLTLASSNVEENDKGSLMTVVFDVTDDSGRSLGQVSPSQQYLSTTGESMLHASVMSSPLEDFFVVFQGLNMDGSLSLDVRVNPLISFVWAGFIVLSAGMLVSSLAGLGTRKKGDRDE